MHAARLLNAPGAAAEPFVSKTPLTEHVVVRYAYKLRIADKFNLRGGRTIEFIERGNARLRIAVTEKERWRKRGIYTRDDEGRSAGRIMRKFDGKSQPMGRARAEKEFH